MFDSRLLSVERRDSIPIACEGAGRPKKTGTTRLFSPSRGHDQVNEVILAVQGRNPRQIAKSPAGGTRIGAEVCKLVRLHTAEPPAFFTRPAIHT